MSAQAHVDVVLDRAAPSYSRELGKLYDRLRQLEREHPNQRLLVARKESGSKVHVVVMIAAGGKRPVGPSVSASVSRWGG